MLTYQRLIPFVVFLLSLLVASCATSPAPGETSDPSARAERTTPDPAHPNPQAPSLKPKTVSQMARRRRTAVAPSGDGSVFPSALALCPQMKISNAPSAGHDRRILHYRRTVKINGLDIAVAPVEAGCVSSGFGYRNGRPHKGIDLYHADPVKIYAAANGRVREKEYRNDYGNMLVIEHGNGVFARYAHLDRFFPGLEIGDPVRRGQTIGFMGNTASYRIPRHLHYEVLTGDYTTAKGSFGLTPVDLFAMLP